MIASLLTSRLLGGFLAVAAAVACVGGAYVIGKAKGHEISDLACRDRVAALVGLHEAEIAKMQTAAYDALRAHEFKLFQEQQIHEDKLRARAVRAENLLRDLRGRYEAERRANPVPAGCELPVERLSILNEAKRCFTGVSDGASGGCFAVQPELLRAVPGTG
jgi:hypothetical protein